MKSLIWKDPPRIHHGGGRRSEIPEIVEALQSQPGRWAMVRAGVGRSNANSLVSRLKTAGAEACIRTNGGGTEVYARWPK